MHHLKIKVGRPVRVFFPEEIHNTNISRKLKAQSKKLWTFGFKLFAFSTKKRLPG
jgi:hypothetical protein